MQNKNEFVNRTDMETRVQCQKQAHTYTHTHHLLFSICTLVSYSVCVRGNPISPQPPFIVGHKRLSDCLWFMTTRLKVIAAARLLLYKKRYTMRGTMRLNEI